MSAEIIEATKEEVAVDVQKRAFMSKFGKYAVVGVGMATLMGPAMSTANAYVVDGTRNPDGTWDLICGPGGSLTYDECHSIIDPLNP